MITIEQFKVLIDKHIIEDAGKAYYFGNLDLAKRKDIKELPDNFTVYGYLDITNSGIKEFPKGLEVMSELIASETKITELPKDKLRYNDLDISYTQISELKDNMVVYKNLDIEYTNITKLSKGLIVGHKLDLYSTILEDYSNLHKVCCGFNLYKKRYDEIKDTLAPHTIDRFDHIIYVTFKPNHKGAYLFENETGKYIHADYILTKIIKSKGNVYHVKTYENEKISYLVTDGEGHWSHGKTLQEAKEDLLYKINKRNTDEYKELSLNSVLSFEAAIACYRVITGACSFGTKDFIKNHLGKKKKKYTIQEIIELTEGEFGNEEFKKFFS